MSLSEWERRVDELADALDAMTARCEWEALAVAAVEFTALLTRCPGDADAARPRLEAARGLVERILPVAVEARGALERDIRHLAKGRRAVSAYR